MFACATVFAALGQQTPDEQAASGTAAASFQPSTGLRASKDLAAGNPTYSHAKWAGLDPRDEFQKWEGKVCGGTAPRKCAGALALAAKYALQAGENDKARSYANEALQSADILAAIPFGHFGRLHPGVPTADFWANFVLGRLAILDGDIRSAEKYLLASGKAEGTRYLGDAIVTATPNMSLAYELLRRGDQQSKQVVLQYFDEVRRFWADPFGLSAMDRWTKQIEAGDMPDFQVDYGGKFRISPLLY
jgi:hypothetical protein